MTPGEFETVDTLPPALQTGSAALLTYRVQLFNATGHSAGDSAGAFAASGAAPAPIAALRVTASEQGAILEWNAAATSPSNTADVVDFKRVDLSAPAAADRRTTPAQLHFPQPPGHPSPKHKSGKTNAMLPAGSPPEVPKVAHLRAAESTAHSRNGTQETGTAGTVDAAAAIGDSYTYTAQRLRSAVVDGHSLELRSEPSPPVTVAMRDTFPPKIPADLAAISGFTPPDAATIGAPPAPYIDLSWEPGSETDLAGYRVYRQLARPDGSPQGPLARLTALPIAVPAYRDVAVRAGQGYIYSVTAVDAAGNESAPSAKALETIPPEARDFSH